MGKLILGYWDCPYCGNKGIRGDVHSCPSCARARGDVKFYMKDLADDAVLESDQRENIEYVEEESEINRNPDWYCSFCNSLNSDNAAFCTTCGATREDSESNYFDQLKKRQEQEAAERNAQNQVPDRKTGGKNPFVIFVAVLLAIIGIVVFMNSNKTDGNLKVTGVSWERTISIEAQKEFSESAWSLPDGAVLTGSQSELHHYDSVLDHYEDVQVPRSRQVLDHYETYYTYRDLGNGYYEEVPHERPVYSTEYYTETESRPVYVSVPRYQTKYYYTIRRWVPERSVNAAGDDHEPRWPEFTLAENEREGERNDIYTFSVTDEKGNTTRYRISEDAWNGLNTDDMLTITSKRNGSEYHITDKEGNHIAQIWRYQ